MHFGLLVKILFIVFCYWPMHRSCGDLFFADGFLHNARRISYSPKFSFRTIISSFARSRSFIVRISRSIFPLLLWSYMGHCTCLIYLFSQNYLKRLLLKIVAESVRIVCGIPCLAIKSFKKAITLSVSGFLFITNGGCLCLPSKWSTTLSSCVSLLALNWSSSRPIRLTLLNPAWWLILPRPLKLPDIGF